MRRKVYMAAGYNTISLGTGRKEFHPKKPRPGLEHYFKEAARGTLDQIGGAGNVDESVVGNFMASRFVRQAHLNALFPMVDAALRHKPATRVEGACASGGLALLSGIRSVLAETADVVLALGIEVQNSVKAVYGADFLAMAGWFPNRKEGHAYFFPGQFSDRTQAYYDAWGKDETRPALARWYKNAIENARLCPTAQEYTNNSEDLISLGMTEPDAQTFTACLNVMDCSKVSDGASAIAILSEEGLKRCGISPTDAIEITGFGHAVEDITQPPVDPLELSTVKAATTKAMEMARITKDDLATVETHDCFTIAGLLGVEALGLAEKGKGKDFVLEGHTARGGKIPFNTTGGLIGWGHPTGATGVHMAVTLWEQLTGKAGDAQIEMPADRPYGLSMNMGGDDKTAVSLIMTKIQ
ncbi:MAG TPA: 3-ketoacyl-CoA thiolase [Bacteroides sp.]|nr:3-ketoacyl-CoA thiolase [Bacteroides sp.]